MRPKSHRTVLSLAAPALVAAAALSSVAGAPAAQAGPEAYRKVVAAEPGLASWWPFDGDLNDAKGRIHGQPKGGEPQFAEGPAGGKALVLDKGRFVTMGAASELDFPETTVELWFKPDFAPNPGYNPCLIAKRADGDHANTRFSVHVMGDYARMAVWNGRAVMLYSVGSGPLKRGQWHHLAVTCTAQAMRMFVDGVQADLEGSAEGFNFAKKAMPLSIGSSQPRGAELMACSVDEVAVYRKALTEETIAAHVDAMGWRDRREQLANARQARLEKERQVRLAQDARREKRRAELLADPALFDRGKPTIYAGERLGAVSFTLGGIGAGSIQINGKAERAIWQIFNNYRNVTVPNSFFAVRAAAAGGQPAVRALQTAPVGPFPAMKELTLRGEYPFAWYTFTDPGLPVKVSLEAFNPLVPLCAKDSAIPCAIFNLTAENPTDRPVEVSFLAAQQNAVGFLGDKPIQGRTYPGYGANKNAVVRGGKATLLSMTSDKPKTAAGQGDLVLAAVADDASAEAAWTNLDALAKDFSDGVLEGQLAAGPSPPGETLDGALAVAFTLAPGQKRTAAFVLAWHFPNVRHGIDAWHAAGNWYENHWQSAQAVADDVVARLDDLTAKTRLFHDSLYESNLPYWLLDRISSQLAVLRSQTCYWGKDGYFGAWEGCGGGNGCCHGNCNHVWHYAQAHGRLFPEIARQMRAQEFRHQARDGAVPHRQFASHPAFDGQCGAVLNSYREHLASPDRKWLDANWPSIRRAMDYTIATWDKDRDGVLAGPQWNTLDGALGGSTSWLGTLYLAALSAAERMALLENDPETAKRYAAVRQSGAKKQDETLFNGEYYIQIPDPEPREDYATGCSIDQLLGQWWAHQLDLGWLYPPEHARTALGSLFKYNFRGTMQGLKQAPRKFVADDDPATQMITWPKGPRPAKVILYGDEAMTGFEYAAAGAMIQAGLVREGFATARAVWVRYDGRLRTGLTPGDTSSWGYSGNPFGDDECGKFYARAMSVWSLLLAAQGFVYDGPGRTIGFRPVWKPDDHASFFTAAEGWGLFRQRRTADAQTGVIEVRCGRLPVRTLVFELPKGAQPAGVSVEVEGKSAPAKHAAGPDGVRIDLEAPVTIEAGGKLTVSFSLRRA